MTRARWMLGTLGALATIALVPALPASAQSDPALFTEITNSADGSRWAVHGDQVIKTISGPASSPTNSDKWVVSEQSDGSVTIRNQATRECVESQPWFDGAVYSARCEQRSDRQKWILNWSEDGYVITPKNAPDLAVSVQELGASDSWLTLKPRSSTPSGSAQDDLASVFRLSA
ncbi:RICIN domain-containing protein [Saccharopolyspora sp. K220]|uniref:RICIN domain-containing protein n=1 Tax=Saccharopolyspora soli TaxID=2926618 RepID=UPI001F594342|nr:RICIN domain-containing protein [Saccharopolyspora soli]MCI2419367.1 RICIN domain-containing protein [Saccharopolyspora soli]